MHYSLGGNEEDFGDKVVSNQQWSKNHQIFRLGIYKKKYMLS